MPPAACSVPGENARSWEALGEARPGQSSLSAGAVRYRAWAQSWIHARGEGERVLALVQYSCLENPAGRGVWCPWGCKELDTTEQLHSCIAGICPRLTPGPSELEKEMATHSSILAWRIPGAEEPGGLPSMGSRRVGQD